jgi:hypothetical protein
LVGRGTDAQSALVVGFLTFLFIDYPLNGMAEPK